MKRSQSEKRMKGKQTTNKTHVKKNEQNNHKSTTKFINTNVLVDKAINLLKKQM